MDIDIDIRKNFSPKRLFDIVEASNVENGVLVKHNVGVYFQNMPVDPITGYAAIPMDKGLENGYFKFDMIHVGILDLFDSKEQMNDLLKIEPDWKLLENRENVSKLFHIANHFHIVDVVKPKSVMEIADILALIRPGKTKLLDKYLKNRELVRSELYTKRVHSDMRKSHAVAYALLIVLQLHLIKSGKL